MTKQESFKRRVRTRMEKTGERYMTARRALIDQADRTRSRTWMAEPEASEQSVTEATGKGWDEWCDIIDRWAGRDAESAGAGRPVTDTPIDDHTAIAAYLRHELGVDPWWSQTVTVGYERITGLRLPYQRPDGTFTAGRSATLAVDGPALRAMLLSDRDRGELFPGHETELRSRPEAKRIRIGLGPGVAQITIDQAAGASGSDGPRYKVAVTHEKLATFGEVEQWKHYWGEWLAAVGEQPG